MKISKQQISALASKLTSEIEDSNTKKEKEEWKKCLEKFKKTKEYSYIDHINKFYNEIAKTTHTMIAEGSILVMSGYKSSIKYDYNLRQRIENDILISTIECDNLDEIINKIKEKYK